MSAYDKALNDFCGAYINNNSFAECVLLIDGKRFCKTKNRFVFKNKQDALLALKSAFCRYMYKKRTLHHMTSFTKNFDELVENRVIIIPAYHYYRFQTLLYKEEPSNEQTNL